ELKDKLLPLLGPVPEEFEDEPPPLPVPVPEELEDELPPSLEPQWLRRRSPWPHRGFQWFLHRFPELHHGSESPEFCHWPPDWDLRRFSTLLSRTPDICSFGVGSRTSFFVNTSGSIIDLQIICFLVAGLQISRSIVAGLPDFVFSFVDGLLDFVRVPTDLLGLPPELCVGLGLPPGRPSELWGSPARPSGRRPGLCAHTGGPCFWLYFLAPFG
ncbi:hypothetical protein ATANTOWER_032269, partial [Ataeniobius toweri]|nr:hypothetical protein [Ataeniobius toweri]